MIGAPVSDSTSMVYQLLVHSNIRSDWGWFGRWVLISPAAHRIHHSSKPEHYNKNISVLVIWDRLFGTWYAGNVPAEQLGIVDKGYGSKNFLVHSVHDLWVFIVAIGKYLTKPIKKKTVILPAIE
jgi:sterol desaturase/sphingolipid hydroxylase (fatty acid hydroxylase superfamily)